MDCKGGKHPTSIFPKHVLEALKGRLNGREEGYVFEAEIMAISRLGRSNGCWMVAAGKDSEVELVGEYLNPQFALFSDHVT